MLAKVNDSTPGPEAERPERTLEPCDGKVGFSPKHPPHTQYMVSATHGHSPWPSGRRARHTTAKQLPEQPAWVLK